MKHYIDFAAAITLEYMLIDAGWFAEDATHIGGDITKTGPDFNMTEIMNHAREKGVKMILWVDWRALDINWTRRCRCSRSGASRASKSTS